MIYALSDGLARTRYSNCPLGRVGQHLRSYLNGSTRHLSNLLDLGAALADEGATLGSGHNQAQSYRRPWDTTTASGTTATLAVMELRTPLFEFLAYKCKGFEDRVCRAGNRHYSLRAGAVRNIDLGA
jgi:hypothetical protein